MRNVEHSQYETAKERKNTGYDGKIEGKRDTAEGTMRKAAYEEIGYVFPDDSEIKSRAVHTILPS